MRFWSDSFCALALMAVLATGLLAGCGETYTREKLADSIVRLCREEYGMQDLRAKLEGKTVGINITVPQLFEGLSGFNKDAMDVVEDVLLCVRRVCLSTDADVEFFDLVLSDEKTNMQVSLTGYVNDIKKALMGFISRNDYSQRMRMSVVPDPYRFGVLRINKMFDYLDSKKLSLNFLAASFNSLKDDKKVVSSYLMSLLQSKVKRETSNSIKSMRSRVLARDSIVFYVVAEEVATMDDGGQKSVERHDYEFLIKISISNYNAVVDSVFPLTTYNAKLERLEHNPLSGEFSEFDDYQQWPEKDFYVGDVDFQKFLVDQIAQRIRQELAKSDDSKLLKKIYNIEGVLVDEQDEHIVEMTFTSNNKEGISQLMLDLTRNTVVDVCRGYEFTNLSLVRIRDKQDQVVAEYRLSF